MSMNPARSFASASPPATVAELVDLLRRAGARNAGCGARCISIARRSVGRARSCCTPRPALHSLRLRAEGSTVMIPDVRRDHHRLRRRRSRDGVSPRGSGTARRCWSRRAHALPRDGSTLDFAKVVHEAANSRARSLARRRRHAASCPRSTSIVGGKTKWYGAALLRFGDHEFEADREHQCLAGRSATTEIAPYYDEAERLLGVRTLRLRARSRAHSRARCSRARAAGAPSPCRWGCTPRSATIDSKPATSTASHRSRT